MAVVARPVTHHTAASTATVTPAKADATSGNIALWGEDVSSLYGKTIITGQSEHGSVTHTLPSSITAGTPDVAGILMCLSCHDGNLAQAAMMKNKVFETLPASYGTKNTIPTLLGNDDGSVGNYLNDHPVGNDATVGCGGQYDWDCTIDATGKIQMNGPNSFKFVQNYGFFVSTKRRRRQAGRDVHHLPQPAPDERGQGNHGVSLDATTSDRQLRLPSGDYATMFFIRAPYNPASGTSGSNQTAQFCRQCHGGEANEMNGGTAIPTVSKSLCMKRGGGNFPSPAFSHGGQYGLQILTLGLFLLATALSQAQVASHTPTVFRPAPAQKAAASSPQNNPASRSRA